MKEPNSMEILFIHLDQQVHEATLNSNSTKVGILQKRSKCFANMIILSNNTIQNYLMFLWNHCYGTIYLIALQYKNK